MRVVPKAVPTCLFNLVFFLVLHICTPFRSRARGSGDICPATAENYSIIAGSSIIDHRVAVDQSPERSTRHIDRHAADWPIIAAAARTLEIDPDQVCIRKDMSGVGWLAGSAVQCMHAVLTPCGSCRSVRGGGGARRLSTSVRPFRSTELFHSTKASLTSRQSSLVISLRRVHTSIRAHTPARPVYRYN